MQDAGHFQTCVAEGRTQAECFAAMMRGTPEPPNEKNRGELMAQLLGELPRNAGGMIHMGAALTQQPCSCSASTCTKGQTTVDPNATFKAEYAQQRATYQRDGVSEDDYVFSRRVDEGLDVLQPAALDPIESDAVKAVDLADPENAKFRAEFAENRAAYEREGVSEKGYVLSRRVDEGLSTLKPEIAK
jgi:hypothetical protein